MRRRVRQAERTTGKPVTHGSTGVARRATVAVTLAAFALISAPGCYTSPPAPVDATYLRQLAEAGASRTPSHDCTSELVRDVVVLIGSRITAAREERFIAHEGPELLRRGVLGGLQRRGLTDPTSPGVLLLGVDQFRLRSTAATFWVGLFMGPDHLDVSAIRRCGGQEETLFLTAVTSMKPGFVMASSQGRFNGVLKLMSRKIVDRYARYPEPVREGRPFLDRRP